MFKNAIWNNPVGWAERGIGQKQGYFAYLIFHIIAGAGIMIRIVTRDGDVLMALAVLTVATLLPMGYLMVMKRLLRELKK